MSNKKRKILFIELPQLCVAENAIIEHIRLAETYLSWAILKRNVCNDYQLQFLSQKHYKLDNRSLIKTIIALSPDIIVTTLYLWNIERSIFLMKALKENLSPLCTIGGGPEVATDHPFLFKEKCFDYLIIGEGEFLLNELLNAIHNCLPLPDYQNILRLKKDGRYAKGKKILKESSFPSLLPPCSYKKYRVSEGIAYMELTRGCVMKCAFCRYNQLQRKLVTLPLKDATSRFNFLLKKDVKEIRFIDPTISSYKHFKSFLKKIVSFKKEKKKKLKIFAELNASHINDSLARLMKKAGFEEVEIGLQSINKKVLKVINRPTNLEKLKNGIISMLKAKIKVIVDVMVGLPFQTKSDILKSIEWAKSIKGAYVQVLHTLLIPGTELRKKSKQYQIEAETLPPYRVLATKWIKKKTFFLIYEKIRDVIGEQSEFPTKKFIGYSLPDLFSEKIRISFKKHLSENVLVEVLKKKISKGKKTHRAIIFEGSMLFEKRFIIKTLISYCVQLEPHIFWQFVLSPLHQEPLDLFDYLIETIRSLNKINPHINDRWIEFDTSGKICSRKILVLLQKKANYEKEWMLLVEELLMKHFY